MNFKLQIDMNVLNHLGIGLYSSTPAVVTEIIANAWDAAATEVWVTIGADEITVVDNGNGMGSDELQSRFLKVGYARRDAPGGNRTDPFDRPVMGRKGIGKLAMFSLAKKIEVHSHKAGSDPVAVLIDVERLKTVIKDPGQGDYELEPAPTDYEWGQTTGTKLILRELETGTDRTAAYLRPRVARRFSIIGEAHKFKVFLDDVEITKADRNYHSSLQFLWYLDEESRETESHHAKNLAVDKDGNQFVASLDGVVVAGSPYKLRGFIGAVAKPSQLKSSDDVNMNQISLFANGRVFQEDMLKEIGSSRVFSSYLIGEIHADFLDADTTDRATANREAVRQSDPLVQAVYSWLRSNLNLIAEKWDEWRRDLNPDIDDGRIKIALETWYASMNDARDIRLARRLVNPILQNEYANDTKKDLELKKELLRSAIVGFEKLRIRSKLDLLENITDVSSPEFSRIFVDLNDIEATYYHDITRSRLQIIEKFGSLTDAHVLEKVAQEYLFQHLWLLDPTWDRVGGSEQMELTLTKELMEIEPDAEAGARLDIAYRTASGRHVIIELKRPGLKSVSVYALAEQGGKYRASMKRWIEQHPDAYGTHGLATQIDVYFVTEHTPRDPEDKALEKLKAMSMQCFTYRGMIENARRSYREYIESTQTASRIDGIIAEIK
jgi:hypothetical protein